MSNRLKIGILGGTFDPIHDAHLHLGREALKKIGLDRIIFMPTGNSYFKSDKRNITDADHRSAMVQLAIKGEEAFIFSDREIKRHGETYTAETLMELAKEYPEVDFYFIMGADSLRDMEKWYAPDVIFKHAVIIVANRNHQVDDERLNCEIKHLTDKFDARIYSLDFESMDVSSSDIRKSLQMGEWHTLPIPENVLAYIIENGLYRDEPGVCEKPSGSGVMDEEQIHKKLRQSLKPSRYQHTLGVAETAVKLARHYGTVSEDNAYLAGLLHDCGKEAGDALSHASIGAELARTVYGVEDREILSAIACHTTGKPGMSDLEKIIFIADYIEPGRDKAPNLEILRSKAFVDLDETIVLILRDTLSYLKNIGATIDEHSIKTYNFYNTNHM